MKHVLTKNAVVVLRSILHVPGWAADIEMIYRGGKLLSSLPEFKALNDVEALEKVEVEIDANDRDACKAALQFACTKQIAPASSFLNEVIETLELIAKPK